MVPSTPHQSKIGKGLVETLSSIPSTKRPPRPGVPLQAEVRADELNWHLDSLPAFSGGGYVGLPANPGIRARSPFPAVAQRILGSACEREEGRETVSRGGDPHTIDMDTTRTDNPIEYSTIPEAAIVENTVPPVISPYNLYRKRGSLPQGIRALIASKKRMNQKNKSTPQRWTTVLFLHQRRNIRLVLSYHGRKGLPVTAKIALLDTQFLEYEHAVIGTVLTTLNAGSIVITGANQVPASVMATLHHQLVFRLQNHSLDLPNQGSRDAPMVLANSGTEVPTIIQIPRQILRKDLEKLVPTEWITNYESLQQQHETIRATISGSRDY
ncbi:UNVERIFIED_CONTAM: polyprotein [Sesamum latifolium]|uniref:Polyprotein n=1 Tax=Sesamum latifolium TaxID=2727402 RepID=A0AAW2WU76_9LAMI